MWSEMAEIAKQKTMDLHFIETEVYDDAKFDTKLLEVQT